MIWFVLGFGALILVLVRYSARQSMYHFYLSGYWRGRQQEQTRQACYFLLGENLERGPVPTFEDVMGEDRHKQVIDDQWQDFLRRSKGRANYIRASLPSEN